MLNQQDSNVSNGILILQIQYQHWDPDTKKKEKEKAKVTKVYLNLKWWGSSWKVTSAINNSQFKTITSRIVSSKAQVKDN